MVSVQKKTPLIFSGYLGIFSDNKLSVTTPNCGEELSGWFQIRRAGLACCTCEQSPCGGQRVGQSGWCLQQLRRERAWDVHGEGDLVLRKDEEIEPYSTKKSTGDFLALCSASWFDFLPAQGFPVPPQSCCCVLPSQNPFFCLYFQEMTI